MKIPVEAIQNFDEEQAVNVIANTFNKEAMIGTSVVATINNNPIDELMKLHEEKMALYERMIKAQDEMIARYEQLINNR
ncbi:hypothetical protein [Niabella hibiscisoli]|uniref:hypothetical protein n=1 Tax=Niabella hibiscisoli TaxID=1825928 RepID=UPI001F0FCF40|nr:hypothetical protein [Niabella hibiscisoli]MCH5719855.1 hypothetical protein [Niabella hibiscisoli]MCH5719866.1 hypothetical protein [Niabella hibiscisoli]